MTRPPGRIDASGCRCAGREPAGERNESAAKAQKRETTESSASRRTNTLSSYERVIILNSSHHKVESRAPFSLRVNVADDIFYEGDPISPVAFDDPYMASVECYKTRRRNGRA
jgi:hypothetical protein